MDIYAEEIISHYEHPHNRGKLATANAEFHDYNPVCGDDITMFLDVKDGIIKDAKFDGAGCAISIGAASMLTDLIKGKSVKDVEKMGVHTVVDMLGIDPGPARLKCATLSLKAAQKALVSYSRTVT
jgi:nitrogen fixation NifU-like protein